LGQVDRIRRGSHKGLPRRRPTDKTRHLDFRQVTNLVNAVAFTHGSGNPLTVAVTLIWAHVPDFHENRLSKMTTSFLDRLGRWLRRHAGVELRAVWTRERGWQKGHHLNVMANIPVRFVGQLSAYLNKSFKITGKGLSMNCGKFGMKVLTMQMGCLRYICKSMDHNAFVYRWFETHNVADMLNIRHAGTDGEVKVKRAGTTQNIGPKARQSVGWRDKRSIEAVADLLNPKPRRNIAA
jgi:hypothetical protein